MKKKTLYVYACGVDWQHEIDAIPSTIYPSVEVLKESVNCWQQCGIVKLKVIEESWPEPQDFTTWRE